jgi:hypothetical protein
MLENYFTIQDMLAIACLIFIFIKLLQRKEGWGWKR